jgi:hypothetical protein
MREQLLLQVNEITEQSELAEFDVALSIVEECVKMMEINDLHRGDSLDGFVIFQEGQILDDATGAGKNESLIKKALLLLPRLLGAIVKAIKTKLTGQSSTKNINQQGAFMKYGEITTEGLSDSEIEKIKKQKKESPVYKAIVAAGCVGIAAAGAGFAFRISDYSEAVEFKDDVSFTISEDLKGIRVVFPFYKIEAITNFNNKFDGVYQSLQADFSGNLKDMVNLMKTIVTNQARVSERDFANPPAWTDYYQNTIKAQFAKFADNIDKMKSLMEEHKITENTVSYDKVPLKEFIKKTEELTKKLPNDLELIEKFNSKLINVYDILANPNAHSKHEVKKAAKLTFKPIFSKDEINIYKLDTAHLMNAVKLFNEFSDEHKKADYDTMLGYAQSSSKFQEAVHEIEQQFNCKIDYQIFNGGGATVTYKNKPGDMNVTFNKQRGFDLGGATLKVYIDPSYSHKIAGKEGVMGQMLCSIMCHEIFHNIAILIHIYGTKISDAIKKVFANVFTVYENIKAIIIAMLQSYARGLGISYIEDDLTIKRIAYVIENFDDKQKMTEFTNKIANDADKDIVAAVNVDNLQDASKAELFFSKLQYFLNSEEANIIGTALTAIFYRYNFKLGGLFAISTLFMSIYGATQLKMEKTNEETMCDMCAAIYKLPVYLKDVSSMRKSKTERDVASHGRFDVHSATFDRQSVSLGLAKEMLNSGEQLDPDVKKYLEFIVEKNEGNQYAERKFTKKQMKKSAPAFTENINRAITNFVKDHNITLIDEGEIS